MWALMDLMRSFLVRVVLLEGEGWVVRLVMTVTSWGWMDWINFWSVSSCLLMFDMIEWVNM